MSRVLAALVVLCVLTVNVLCADEKAAEATGDRPKTFRRLIPADVLRDFPGVCFASTRCATVEPGESWELAPFCGRSTCVKSDAEENGEYHLFELVEDCGPLPKANPKCKLSEKTNKTAPFPECCPSFECEPGVKLEYPDIPLVANSEASSNTTAKPTKA
ncbi:uncharacterized protein LOC135845907 [Planococcus citri]|uniref:uncharacterized protein LOC135845907 n=1 Tax=Planococcus citri TaxID=170843 RepID=UPI0031F722E6